VDKENVWSMMQSQDTSSTGMIHRSLARSDQVAKAEQLSLLNVSVVITKTRQDRPAVMNVPKAMRAQVEVRSINVISTNSGNSVSNNLCVKSMMLNLEAT
jgi:hypothetical protein